MKYYFAPVQGHTDAAYRALHSQIYNCKAEYCTPFIRLEKGDIRPRDLRDAAGMLAGDDDRDASLKLAEMSSGCAQVIFRDYAELSALVDRLMAAGHRRIDINMGCPFPLQTARGRGAATVARPECAEAVRRVVNEAKEKCGEMDFSVKLRLGMESDSEWRPLLEVLNELPLSHLTMHPRTARDQYSQPLHYDAFADFLLASRLPVVYNGEIHTPEDALSVIREYPAVKGLMTGRGVLGRPSLINEMEEGQEWPRERRLLVMLEFHDALLDYYSAQLIGGSHQVLDKIRPFWEYAESEIGRKVWKAIKKASNMEKYETAVAMVRQLQ